MIHIAIGTKAHFIKMSSIMRRLQEKNIPFNLIDFGQHSLITQSLRQEFGIKEPDVYLSKGENVSRVSQGLIWSARIFFKGLSSHWVKQEVFKGQGGICLIHGNTASTILALYLAKRAALKVALIEGGLRSFHYFEPFPEEILGVIAMRFSDILFAPTMWAFNNLKKMGLEKRSVLLSANTSLDAVFYSLNEKIGLGIDLDRFALVTAHRMENIFSRKRLEFILDLIQQISRQMDVVFVQDPPTINQLNRLGLSKRVNQMKNVHCFKILSHSHFVHLLNKCDFIVTDGGSIQEEAFYLNKPCLLLRCVTEREEGLGENVVICGFSKEKTDYFLNNYTDFKRKSPPVSQNPSEEIVQHIISYA